MINKILQTDRCLSMEAIKAYLSDQLDEQQRFEVENHLLDCPLCSDAVEGFANHYNFETNTELSSLTTKEAQHTTRAATGRKASLRRISYFNRIAAAAVFLLMMAAGWMYWNNQQPERLYQAYHEPYANEALIATRSSAERPESKQLQKALSLQKAGDYQASIAKLRELLDAQPAHPLGSMMLGVAYLEEGQTEKAKELLMTVRINHELYYEEASWYLALAYLKDDQPSAARPILEELSRQEVGLYRDRAISLLAEW